MLPRRLSSLLSVLVLAVGPGPAPPHTWIADLRANPSRFAAVELLLEGDVVELRSISPGAERGMYRLVDGSDHRGVLVRTDHLPGGGGAYRVLAGVAAAQPSDSNLVVDEFGRMQLDRPSVIPLLIAVLSGLGVVALTVLLLRVARQERRHFVAQPLWLLPFTAPNEPASRGAEPPRPPLRYDPEAEEADIRQRERLRQRKQQLAYALVAALAVTVTSGTWAARNFPRSPRVPVYVSVNFGDAGQLPATSLEAPDDTIAPDRPLVARPDSVQNRAYLAPRNGATDPKRLPSVAVAPPSPTVSQPTTAPAGSTMVAIPSLAPAPPPIAAPPPAPAPVPPPAPPSAEPKQPVRSPADEKARATTILADLAVRLVAAINDRDVARLETLLPETLSQDAERRARFLKLVKEFGPRASLDGIGDPTLAEDRARATFTLSLSWRGDFGVARKKAGRFVGMIDRQEGTWRVEGISLVDAVP